MNKHIVLVLLLSVCGLLQAGPASAAEPSCIEQTQPKCWLPLAEGLAAAPPPRTEREHSDRLFSYIFLGKIAYSTGDLEDAKRFYAIAFELLSTVTRDRADQQRLLQAEAAKLALSMHDYPLALDYLDAVRVPDREEEPEMAAYRAAALIGLGRHEQARHLLAELLARLPYDGSAPFCGLGVGLEFYNPYDLARRIAAYYQRQGWDDDARQLLDRLESRRQEVLAASSGKQPAPGGLWASVQGPAGSPMRVDPLKDTLGL
ncbi:hypothetical protein ACLB1G_00720 [Oxalobacteraceae bacterium A2-2]